MSGRRANGEGSIVWEADRKRWKVLWTENGQRRGPKRFTTKTEAAKFLRGVAGRVEVGLPGIDSSTAIASLAEQWQRTAPISQGVSTSSMRVYSSVLRLHVLPVVGDLPIKDLKPSNVVEVLASMEARGLSKSYQHQAHKVMSGIVKMAMADGLIARNPVASVAAPRGGHKPKVVPSREQVQALREAAPNARMRAFIAVLAYSGLRISEALSLRWSDWDGGATIRVMTPKPSGGQSRPRAIPVPVILQNELRAWRKAQLAERLAARWWNTAEDWLLSSNVGTQWDPGNARKRLRKIVNANPEAGVEGVCPGVTPHSLRHATATVLLEEAVPMRVVSDLLGHSSTRVTADIYSHVTNRLAQQAADALDGVFGQLIPSGINEAPPEGLQEGEKGH